MKDRNSSGTILHLLTAIFVILAAYLTATQWFLPKLYQQEAANYVDRIVKESGLWKFTYPGVPEITSEKDFTTAIYGLASSNQSMKDLIQQTLGTPSIPDRTKGKLLPLPSKDYYIWQAKQKEYPAAERRLRETVLNWIDDIYEQAAVTPPISKKLLVSSYNDGGFDFLFQEMEAIHPNDSYTFLNSELFKLVAEIVCRGDEIECVPVDLLYAYSPDFFLISASAYLKEEAEKNDLNELTSALKNADAFEARYNTVISEAENARQVKASLEAAKQEEENRKITEEYAARPDAPSVGMSYNEALKTKLGTPTRISKKQTYVGQYSKTTYYDGNMYWEVNSWLMFRAEFKGNKITKIWDNRPSSSKKTSQSGSSRKKKSDSADPYDVHYFDDADDFADEWAGEFGDGNVDEGWDDAWDYWHDNH